ncbi:hypothetical protein KUCAC02_007953, partial [Chaenocephalus aceratus]
MKKVHQLKHSGELCFIDSSGNMDRENCRYEKFLRHLDRLYARRECWALRYRGSFLTRGNNTNNFAEAAMRVLKDNILQRTKAFNLPQLFDLLTSRLETYYEGCIVDVALGRWESFQRAKFLPQDGNIAASRIQQIEDKKFVALMNQSLRIRSNRMKRQDTSQSAPLHALTPLHPSHSLHTPIPLFRGRTL